MNAVIRFTDGYEIQISKIKYVTYKNSNSGSIIKIDKFEDFFLKHENYNFICENSNFVANGKDIHFIRFDV